jgi:nucleotide-binding universal stress UspA family protein
MEEICRTTHSEKLLLASDGSEFSEGAVREAIKLAKTCASRLTVISVIDYNPEFEVLAPQVVENKKKLYRQYLDRIEARAKEAGIECETLILEGEDAYRTITDEAARNQSTMIIMGRRGRTGLKRLVIGNVTARVIGHSPCNVLVVPKDATLDFKSIVVATDGSKYSTDAVAEAITIAKRDGSALTVIAAVPSELLTPTDIDFTMNQQRLIAEQEMNEAEKNAKEAKESAQKEGVDVKAFVLSGRPYDAIIQTAQEMKADLIVLGSHGRTGIEKFLMGSVAERVILLSSCPILVVKSH